MHSSRIRTARKLPYGRFPLQNIPLDRDPLDRDPPGQRPPKTETPGERPPLDRDPLGQGPHLVNRITDRCKNVALPHFVAGGKHRGVKGRSHYLFIAVMGCMGLSSIVAITPREH